MWHFRRLLPMVIFAVSTALISWTQTRYVTNVTMLTTPESRFRRFILYSRHCHCQAIRVFRRELDFKFTA